MKMKRFYELNPYKQTLVSSQQNLNYNKHVKFSNAFNKFVSLPVCFFLAIIQGMFDWYRARPVKWYIFKRISKKVITSFILHTFCIAKILIIFFIWISLYFKLHTCVFNKENAYIFKFCAYFFSVSPLIYIHIYV